MEYLVPLIIVLVIVIVVVIGTRIMRRRGRSVQESGPGTEVSGRKTVKANREISRENAEAASARLTPEEHRRIYSLIAQRQVLNAVKEYRTATRLSLGDSAAAVAALAQFPQSTPEKAAPQQPKPQQNPPVVIPDAIKEGPLTVADIIGAAPEVAVEVPAAPSAYRYRAIVSRGEDIREVASTRLNEQIFSQIQALARAGKHDDAAHLLRNHSDIGVTEAQEFVSMIGPEDEPL